jgi:hypothetical protein
MNIVALFAIIYNFKIIKTPIYKNLPLCVHHHVLKIYSPTTPTFFIDFAPEERINDPYTILKLLQGKFVHGKIRVLEFPSSSIDPYVELAYYYPMVADRVQHWDSDFQLYNHNCQTFCKYLQEDGSI